MKHQYVPRILFIFCILIIADLLLVALSVGYRNQLGVIDGKGITGYLYRLLPDILMLSFYGVFFLKYKKSNALPLKLLTIHSVFFMVLGILLCIPWGGLFFAPLTPVGILYLGAISLLAEGFYVSLSIAVAFFILNLYLLLIRKNIV